MVVAFFHHRWLHKNGIQWSPVLVSNEMFKVREWLHIKYTHGSIQGESRLIMQIHGICK